MLHNGRVMITSIAGVYPATRDPVTGKERKRVKVQPGRFWTYLDFKDKMIKWGDDLPLARYHHCVVKFNETTAFIFGGGDTAGQDGKGHVIRDYKRKQVMIKELRSGFFMHFPDPDTPQRYDISEVADDGTFPCKEGGNRVETQCGVRINQKNGHKELIVPNFEVKEKRPCTAILDMETFTWRKLAQDSRQNINESLISFLIR